MEDSLVLQNQIRENSDDLQNFLRDMDHWEKEMKQKEAELKLMNISDETVCPPIRNSKSRSKKKNHHKKGKPKPNPKVEKDESVEPKIRISAYNYEAWEKFDVESELKKVDGEKKEYTVSESSDDDEEEEISIQSKQQLAIIKKDNGNKFFKAGEYDSAINCYTLGMELDPDNALLPANRAMAFLKKEQFQAAETDCTSCLSLDPTYVKAYLRRASARSALNKHFLAKQDFLKALEMEPDNKEAQKGLEKINKEINMETNCWKEKDKKAIQVRSHLEDVKEQKEDESLMPKDFSVESYFRNIEHLRAIKENRFSESSHSKMEPMEEDGIKIENVAKPFSNLSLSSSNVPKPEEFADGNPCDGIENVVSALEQTLPSVPTASFQFLTDWKKISKYPDLKYKYLKQISPVLIQDLFKYYIEPDVFPEILKTLSTQFIENEDDVYDYVKALTTVGRFSTMVMFLSHSEKEDLRTIKNYFEKAGKNPSEVSSLMKLYGV